MTMNDIPEAVTEQGPPVTLIDELKLFDNTRQSAFKECQRKYFFRHVLDLTTDRGSPPLAFGSAWHEAMDIAWTWLLTERSGDERKDQDAMPEVVDRCMEAFNKSWEEEGMVPEHLMDENQRKNLDPRLPVVAEEMLFHYLASRSRIAYDYELVQCELPFIVPLSEDGEYWYTGKLDKLLRKKSTGKYTIIEHKTSSWYAVQGGFNANYIESFSPNSQVDGYLFAGGMLYGEKEIEQLLVDAALVHKKHHDVFKFIPISRMFNNLQQWHHEANGWAQSIYAQTAEYYSRDDEQLASAPFFDLFPRNTGACFNFMRACPYIDICKAHANPLKVLGQLLDIFVIEQWKPYDEFDLKRIGVKLK